MSSGSESSDDDAGLLGRISEAAVDPHKHLNLKKTDKNESNNHNHTTTFDARPPSNRPDQQASNRSESTVVGNNMLRVEVTPEFQNFVARKLGEALDREVEEVAASDNSNGSVNDPLNQTDADQSGIRLFSRSKSVLTKVEEEKQTNRHRPTRHSRHKKKKRKKEKTSTSSSSSDVDEDLVRESAVDPSWVIEKKGAYPDDRQRTAPIEVIAISKRA